MKNKLTIFFLLIGTAALAQRTSFPTGNEFEGQKRARQLREDSIKRVARLSLDSLKGLTPNINYVNNALATKQAVLGYTAEDLTRKKTVTNDSTTAGYFSTSAVKQLTFQTYLNAIGKARQNTSDSINNLKIPTTPTFYGKNGNLELSIANLNADSLAIRLAGKISGGTSNTPIISYANNTGTSLTISWTNVNALYYNLYRYTSGSTSGSLIYTGSDNSFNDTGLTAGTTYNYSVMPVFGSAVTTVNTSVNYSLPSAGYSIFSYADFTTLTSGPVSSYSINGFTLNADNGSLTYNHNITTNNGFIVNTPDMPSGSFFRITIVGATADTQIYVSGHNVSSSSFVNGVLVYDFSITSNNSQNVFYYYPGSSTSITNLKLEIKN